MGLPLILSELPATPPLGICYISVLIAHSIMSATHAMERIPYSGVNVVNDLPQHRKPQDPLPYVTRNPQNNQLLLVKLESLPEPDFWTPGFRDPSDAMKWSQGTGVPCLAMATQPSRDYNEWNHGPAFPNHYNSDHNARGRQGNAYAYPSRAGSGSQHR